MENPGDRPAPKRPYTRPVLTTYGTVSTMTQTLNMSGGIKDGGPNNTKS